MQTFWRDVRGVLTSPIEFSRQQVGIADHWLRPVAIVMTAAVLHVVMFITMQNRITGQVRHYLLQLDAAEGLLHSIDNFGALTTFLSVVAGISILPFWLVAAGVMTSWAVLFNGRDNFRKVLIVGGYAHVPLVIYALVAIGIVVFWPPSVDMQSGGSAEVGVIAATIRSYRQEVLLTPSMQIIRILGHAAQLWSLALFAVGASITQRMSYVKGVFAAAFYAAFVLVLGWLLG